MNRVLNKKVNYITILICFTIMMHSQDMHFSQFSENPSLINPALTGQGTTSRFSLVNRAQWRSITNAYKTYGASFETRYTPGKPKSDLKAQAALNASRNQARLGIGGSIYRDKAGDGSLSRTLLNLNIAAFVPTGRKSDLSFGLQTSFGQRRLDNTKLIFQSQYNGSGYDPDINSNENFIAQRYSYFELATGILWSYGFDERIIGAHKELKANIGFSVYHISRSTQKLLADSSKMLYQKYVLHGDLLIGLKNSKLALAPSFLIQIQGPSKEIIVGSMLKYYVGTDSKFTGLVKHASIGYGLYYRNTDAILAVVQYDHHGQYAFGLSYDINISKLISTSIGRGGLELTLRYTPQPTKLAEKQ
jgi:type IX secretion system PorP/SprF family membrane protein